MIVLLSGALGFGLVIGTVAAYRLGNRWPILLWPGEWLPAIRTRRQIRRMPDPDDRIEP
jgi:hypothetical protein